MFVITIIRHYWRAVPLITAGTFFLLFSLCSILSFYPSEVNSAYVLQERVKREAFGLDPVEIADYQNDDQTNGGNNLGRFSRRILPENESFVEENGVKIPISVKSVNTAYTEAKRLYLLKKNCIPRPVETTPKPAGAGGGAKKASSAPAAPPPDGPASPPADPPAEPPADPPAEDAPSERKRRQAVSQTTERVYYCDEFTTTAAPTPAPAPAPSE